MASKENIKLPKFDGAKNTFWNGSMEYQLDSIPTGIINSIRNWYDPTLTTP